MDKVQVAITENARRWGTQLTQMMDISTGDRNTAVTAGKWFIYSVFLKQRESDILLSRWCNGGGYSDSSAAGCCHCVNPLHPVQESVSAGQSVLLVILMRLFFMYVMWSLAQRLYARHGMKGKMYVKCYLLLTKVIFCSSITKTCLRTAS